MIVLMLGVGLVQVYSSSFMLASETRGDGLFFFKRQAIFTFLALVVLMGAWQMPARLLKSLGWGIWSVAVFGLILTLIPGVGHKAGGAARWINLGLFKFEPSELLKVSFPFILAQVLFSRIHREVKWDTLLKALVLLLPLPILLKQPDFGTFAICSILSLTVLFLFGLKWRYIVATLIVAAPTFYYLVMSVPYRRARFMAFLDPWADPERSGFQVIQSLLSFSSGGAFGVGLGQGQGKLFFLPEAHTDFTLAVFGEETGFVGIALLIFFYAALVVYGFRIGERCRGAFEKCVAWGLSSLFAIQVMTNMGVVLGLLPPKGLTLPFMSYGGSSLVATALVFGILLNIEKNSRVSN